MCPLKWHMTWCHSRGHDTISMACPHGDRGCCQPCPSTASTATCTNPSHVAAPRHDGRPHPPGLTDHVCGGAVVPWSGAGERAGRHRPGPSPEGRRGRGRRRRIQRRLTWCVPPAFRLCPTNPFIPYIFPSVSPKDFPVLTLMQAGNAAEPLSAQMIMRKMCTRRILVHIGLLQPAAWAAVPLRIY